MTTSSLIPSYIQETKTLNVTSGIGRLNNLVVLESLASVAKYITSEAISLKAK